MLQRKNIKSLGRSPISTGRLITSLEYAFQRQYTRPLQIDKETGIEFWRISIEKEMLNVRCEFQEKIGLTPEEARKGGVLV